MDTERISQQTEAEHERRDMPEPPAVPLPVPLERLFEEFQDSLEELQVAEEELRQQNQELEDTRLAVETQRSRYQDLFEFAPDGYLVTDMNGIIREANQAAGQMLGAAPAYLIGKSLALRIAAPDRRAFRSLVLQMPRLQWVRDWEACIQPKPGTAPFYASLTAAIIYNHRGEPEGLRWILRDITQRKLAEQVVRGQAQALTQTLKAFTSRLELDTFLNQVLLALAEQLQASVIELWIQEAEAKAPRLHMRYAEEQISRLGAGQETAEPSESLARMETTDWAKLLQMRLPMESQGLSKAPEDCYPDSCFRPAERTLLVPLLLGEEIMGCLRIQRASAHAYPLEEIELAQALAQQAALAIQLTRLAEQQKQQALLQERNRMAQEIHDTLAQGFTGIMVQLEAAKRILREAPEEAETHILLAQNLARESLAEARRSVRALRAQALEAGDLPDALAHLIHRIALGTGIDVQLCVEGAPRSLPAEVENDLLRIGQEALTNALKHSQASCICMRLSYEAQQVELCVQDNGQGFEVHTVDRKGGFGLIGMRERAQRLQGQLTIESREGEGSEVRIVVPITCSGESGVSRE